MLLSVVGGALGVLIAMLTVPLFSTLVPPTLPLDTQPRMDVRVMLVAALFTVLTAVGFGLFPSLRAGRAGFTALREGNQAGGGRKQRVRAVLVTVEVTLAVVLLITSGLLIRAVWRVQAVDPGIVSQDVLTLRTALARPKYDSPLRRTQFYEQVLSGIRALPGVHTAAFTSGLPMITTGLITAVEVPGHEARSARSGGVSHRWVTPQYFKTMGIPLHRGRDVEEGDTGDRDWVAVVSASFVERYWPGQDPIGKRLTSFRRAQSIEIVGVARDGKYLTLTEPPRPYVYRPYLQAYEDMTLHVRTTGDVAAMIPLLRREIRAIDDRVPILTLASMESQTAFATLPQRIAAALLGACAVLALLLAGVGLYGVVAYAVSQRTREIGIRMALGAASPDVLRLVLRQGMGLVLAGLGIGLFGAWALSRVLAGQLYGISARDPLTYAAVATLLGAVAFAATWLPARRATRVDPMISLRSE